MGNVVLLMTALPPTTGHEDLISFAANLPHARVWVLLCARAKEPYGGARRLAAVSRVFSQDLNVTVRLLEEDLAPQNPPDHPLFWDWWADTVNTAFPEVGGDWDFFVASEPYGVQMARALNCRFLPYDRARERNEARGTKIRADLWSHWDSLLPTVRQDFQVRAALFGPESVGKTSVAKTVAEKLHIDWTPEYARPYLETVGPHCDLRSMSEIHAGQVGLQRLAYSKAATPALIMDTDLLTTVGYYPLMAAQPTEGILRDLATLVVDRYYLLSDSAPFVTDPLRYGGHQRESDTSYWESLLRRHAVSYIPTPAGSVDEIADFVAEDLRRVFKEKTLALASFERE